MSSLISKQEFHSQLQRVTVPVYHMRPAKQDAKGIPKETILPTSTALKGCLISPLLSALCSKLEIRKKLG